MRAIVEANDRKPGVHPCPGHLPLGAIEQSSRGALRYIVCVNHQEAEKDAADPAAILAALEGP